MHKVDQSQSSKEQPDNFLLMNLTQELTPTLTADGSFTLFSPEFNQTFHSLHGARQEAELKFVEPTRLVKKAHLPVLKLLDICYGLGYNSAAALEAIWAANPDCQVQLLGLELSAAVPEFAAARGLLTWSEPIQQYAQALASDHQIQTHRLQARLLIGDARQTIQKVCKSGFRADGIFLDPFSPPYCPQLWTVEFLGWVARCLSNSGRLSTYSCSAAVRTALREAGLHIGSTEPVGRRSPGTVASLLAVDLPQLSPQEQEHLRTRAAVPYRDPRLRDSVETIIQRRRSEQQTCGLELTSLWKKRWFA